MIRRREISLWGSVGLDGHGDAAVCRQTAGYLVVVAESFHPIGAGRG